jgi:tetratricopeptide (TPR) repeat protein
MPETGRVRVTLARGDEATARYREGRAALQRGETAAAEAAFRAALVLDADHADALHMLGILEAQRGRPSQAEALFRRAAALRPDDPHIHNSLGNALSGLRRHDEASRAFERALELHPDYSDCRANYGQALLEAGRPAQALAQFERVLARRCDDTEALFRSALALAALRREHDALAVLDRLIALRPGHGDAHFNRGNLLRRAGRVEEALASFDRAVAAEPEKAEPHCNRANALLALKQYPEALAAVERALKLKPDFALAHALRADVLVAMERDAEALASVERALELKPDLAEAHNNRAVALRRLGRNAEAVAGYDRALALRPDYPGAHANRAVSLLELGRASEALAAIERAIALDGDNPDYHNIRGNVLQDLHRHREALAAYARVRALQPGHAEGEWNESLCLLLLGDFARGWPLFESRWKNGQTIAELNPPQPRWDGRRVAGRLLAWGEQGVGDQIHQLGMAEGLRGRADELVLAVSEKLLPLVARSFPEFRVIGLRAAGREPCAMQLPLGSLGGFFRGSWAEFPRRRRYLEADATKVAALRRRLRREGRRLVGLSWHSIAPKVGAAKSLELAALEPLLRRSDLDFVSLQYGDTTAERRAVRERCATEVAAVDGLDLFDDLDGLAALVAACDAVVTISNTTAHLAGALGVDTQLMLPRGVARHWYWHEGRDDSPWYPALRIHRQLRAGDWQPVLASVAAALA